MIESGRLKDQCYLAAVIALLLLMSLMNGYAAVAIATLLIAVGLVLYPNMRRAALVSALIAAFVAITVIVMRTVV